MLDKNEMREVVRRLRPEINDAEFDRLWYRMSDLWLSGKSKHALRSPKE